MGKKVIIVRGGKRESTTKRGEREREGVSEKERYSC